MSAPPSNPQPAKRRFKRKLTPFLCQELLYDYVVGALDPERKQAVEDFLPTDADTQRRLAALKLGFIYTEQLSQFELKPSILRRLSEAESVVQLGQRQLKTAVANQAFIEKLKLSPKALRGAAVAASVMLLIVAFAVVPWRSLMNHRSHSGHTAVELAPIQTKSPVGEFGPMQVAENDQAAPGETAAETEGSGDDEEASGDVSGKVAPPSEAAATADEGNDEGVPQTLAAVPSQAGLNVQVPVMNVASAASAAKPTESNRASADEASGENAGESDKKEAAPKGFVYRAFMSLDNVEDVADEITKKIEALGGEKAGEVELGWQKGEGRYYHFAMPEANQEKLLEQLRAYGPVRISKDPHPRVMPKGRVRIILWVDTSK